MRKIVATAVALVTALSIAAPATGGPTVRHDEEAFADWFVATGEKNHFTWLGAYVLRSTILAGDGEWFDFAGFVKGSCVREKKPKYTSIECVGTDFIHADADDDFEMSPLATDAELRVRHKGRTHAVRWVAEPHGGTYLASEYCFTIENGEQEQEGEGHGAGMWNMAEASGNFFGHRFRGGSRYAALVKGAMVTTCSFREVEYDAEDGTLRLSIRIPR